MGAVVGQAIHGLRVAAPVLADVDDAGLGDHLVHIGVGQAPGDVVDDNGTGPDGRLGGGGVNGVDGDGRAIVRERAHDGDDARLLDLGGDANGARTGGLAADVHDVGALGEKLTAVGDGEVRGLPTAAVGE